MHISFHVIYSKYYHCTTSKIFKGIIAWKWSMPNWVPFATWYIFIAHFLFHLTQRVMWVIVTTERPSSVVVRPLTFHILINSSEATGPIWTKLWWNGPWMAPFQKSVRWSRLPSKMATKLKIEKGGMKFYFSIAALV